MLGYLASGWTCPKCTAPMAGEAAWQRCAACRQTFHLQFGHLVATDATVVDIDLTDAGIDLTGMDRKGPIELPT